MGAIGVIGYLGYLVNTVFKDQIAFPFALSLFGATVIGLGLWYQKNRGYVEAWMVASTPESLRKLRPAAR